MECPEAAWAEQMGFSFGFQLFHVRVMVHHSLVLYNASVKYIVADVFFQVSPFDLFL